MIRPVATLSESESERSGSSAGGPDVSGDDASGRSRGGEASAGLGRRAITWFVIAEIVLVLAVPVLAYAGARALLGTTAGTFSEMPGPGDPGYRAMVEPSPVVAVAEVVDNRLSGISILARPGDDAPGGVVVLVSGETMLDDGRRLAALPVDDALDALSKQLRLRFTQTITVEGSTWSDVLGDSGYRIDNPDPIPSAGGRPAIDVGPVEIDASLTPSFLGTTAPGVDPRSLVFRRQLWWEAVLAAPPSTEHPLGLLLTDMGAAGGRVVLAPVEEADGELVIPADEAEAVINEVVPFPSSARPGDRTVVRIIDRTGRADTRAVAVDLGRRGIEVVEIGIAAVPDEGPSQLIVPGSADIGAMRELAAELGAATVSPDPVEDVDDGVVVLLVGPDIVID